jgi:hypothetical protein
LDFDFTVAFPEPLNFRDMPMRITFLDDEGTQVFSSVYYACILDSSNIEIGYPTLRWDPIPNVLRYHFQLSDDSTFTKVIFDEPNLVKAYRTIPSGISGNWYWRVRAANAAGFGKWSATYKLPIEDSSLSQ